MTTEHDPWGAAAAAEPAQPKKTTAEHIDVKAYAPFTLLSCEKAFAARTLPRKKLHTFVYSILLLLYIGLISLVLLIALKDSNELARSDMLFLMAELLIIWSIGKAVLRLRRNNRFHGWAHTLHLFITVVLRAHFWPLALLSISRKIVRFLNDEGQIFWFQDDFILLTYLLVVYLLTWRPNRRLVYNAGYEKNRCPQTQF